MFQVCSANLHHVEKDFLPQAVLAFEKLVLGVGAGDVSTDELLARGRHLQQLRVLVLHRHVSGVAKQLPDNGPEMMRDAFSDQLLRSNKKKKRQREKTLKKINTLLCSVVRVAVLNISQ